MTPAARVQAAIDVLDSWAHGETGLDRVLTGWGRANRYAGAGDRRAVADLVYDAVRRLRSALWLAGAGAELPPPPALPKGPGRAALIGSLRLDGRDPAELFTGAGYAPAVLIPAERTAPPLEDAPEAVRRDLPDWLMPHLAEIPGPALYRLRSRAALHLRVNRLKSVVDVAIARLAEDEITAVPGPLSPTCLTVTHGARRVARSRAYAEGLIEIQDATSQAVADLAAARPGETVLDYCAGGGGKALALAAAMGGAGQLIAHDVAPARLAALGPRAERAGARIETIGPDGLAPLAGTCDLVLVDAPCSGSGAWRRNPDTKWRLTPDGLAGLVETQTRILAEAARAVRPGGRLVYATCSLLPAENAAPVAAFLAGGPGFAPEGPGRLWTPLDGGDGAYAQILRRAR